MIGPHRLLFSWISGLDSIVIRLFLGLCLVAITHPAPAVAAESAPRAAGLDFARALWDQGDLYRAAGEVKRFLFFNPNDPRAPQARELLDRIEARLNERKAEKTAGGFVPWALSRPAAEPPPAETRLHGRLLSGLVRFYQKRLRSFRDPHQSCPSYPSCSEYAIQAAEKHGAILGTFIYVDRFWREVTTAGKPPFVRRQGRLLHYDPLELNDYWMPPPVDGP